ncbi:MULTISPECIES: hypothetical protein [Burkholderia cepacia complex]|uniref:hypothetical protein n=1 Tax=Burkholderia cepacia complex TaxID=87882 RepID=UPI0012BB007F|nr:MULTISPECIES: hypothetical protein [Burkholderia cepacia complex]
MRSNVVSVGGRDGAVSRIEAVKQGKRIDEPMLAATATGRLGDAATRALPRTKPVRPAMRAGIRGV